MTRKLFTGRMKLAELINVNHNIILLLPRFGIHLGFGDCSVREVCNQYDIAVDFFLLICNIYTYDDYFPDGEELSKIDMSPLVPYLQASHKYYIEERIPHLERHLHHLASGIEERTATALKKYFTDYKNEVIEHFSIEEEKLFPNLNSIAKGNRVPAGNMAHFTELHDNLRDKLSDLTQIIYKYLPGNFLTEELMELVLEILQLSEDLEKHSTIEERLLIPNRDNELSDREKEVLVWVAKGMSSKEIAEKLNLSIHTINSHRKNITQKTGIRSVAGLTLYATLHNLNI